MTNSRILNEESTQGEFGSSCDKMGNTQKFQGIMPERHKSQLKGLLLIFGLFWALEGDLNNVSIIYPKCHHLEMLEGARTSNTFLNPPWWSNLLLAATNFFLPDSQFFMCADEKHVKQLSILT